ncbi:unnamed protein product [Paramecium primaurelia]|uniref:Transmembrane protein n=1 Tax=Paramecium primaurelia TaxID=5886 RepID=A0A8S1LN77_PARPR|nr:unnamed protein product [Paramecium primaurelia]
MKNHTLFPLLMIPLCISEVSDSQQYVCEDALKKCNLNYEALKIDSSKEECLFNNNEPYYDNEQILFTQIENQYQQPSSPEYLNKAKEFEDELSVIQQFQNLEHQEKVETNQKVSDGEQQNQAQYDQICIQYIEQYIQYIEQ